MQITFWYPFHVAWAELRRPGAEAVPPWGLRPCALHHLSLSIAATAWVSNTWNKGQLCFFPNMLCFSGVKAWFFHALPSSFSFALWLKCLLRQHFPCCQPHSPGLCLFSYLWWNSDDVSEREILSQAMVFVVYFCLLPRQDSISTQRIWGGQKKLTKVKGNGSGLWK